MAAPNMIDRLHLTDVHQNSPASFINGLTTKTIKLCGKSIIIVPFLFHRVLLVSYPPPTLSGTTTKKKSFLLF